MNTNTYSHAPPHSLSHSHTVILICMTTIQEAYSKLFVKNRFLEGEGQRETDRGTEGQRERERERGGGRGTESKSGNGKEGEG